MNVRSNFVEQRKDKSSVNKCLTQMLLNQTELEPKLLELKQLELLNHSICCKSKGTIIIKLQKCQLNEC
jgi:hypothetical protein